VLYPPDMLQRNDQPNLLQKRRCDAQPVSNGCDATGAFRLGGGVAERTAGRARQEAAQLRLAMPISEEAVTSPLYDRRAVIANATTPGSE
jgi:hypothetical protein